MSLEKWADFLISAVRHNGNNSHIEALQVREDLGKAVGPPTTLSRQQVVVQIQRGVSYMTAPPSQDGKLRKGQPVVIIRVGNTDYLKTVRNAEAADNLGELPEF